MRGRDPLSDTTPVFQKIAGGSSKAAEQLLPLVYEELRKLAAVPCNRETPLEALHFNMRLRRRALTDGLD